MGKHVLSAFCVQMHSHDIFILLSSLVEVAVFPFNSGDLSTQAVSAVRSAKLRAYTQVDPSNFKGCSV